jgi:hypothetical protein
MKKAPLLLIVLFALANGLTAQNYEQNRFFDEKLKEIINEKLRPGNGSLPDEENNQLLQQGLTIPQMDEIQVVNSTTPESEVHAVINPFDSNNIILCPIKNSSQGLGLPIHYTKDFGKTWYQSSFSPFPKDSRAKVIGGGDPMFTFDGNGRLYYSWIDLYYTKSYYDTTYWGLYWAYSDDGGVSWVRPENDIIGFSWGKITQNYFPEVYDKEWMATDMSNSAYKNTVYISYVKMQSLVKKQYIVLKKKRPSNDAFDSLDVLISDDNFQDVQFTNITVDGQGHVHIIFWGSKDKITYGVWHSVSTNGGESFSNPNLVSEAQKLTGITGVKTSRLYPCTQLVSDQATSALYATWTTTGITSVGNSGADIYFSRSTDEGASWSKPIIVNDDDKTGVPKDQFYSSIAVNKRGIITLTWYDGRYSSSNNNNMDVRYFMAKSKNGGLGFDKNFSISTIPADFRTVGLKNSSFGIGEYNQVLITNSYAIPVWSDGRTNDGNLDIYVAFVKLDSTYVGINDISVVSDNIRLEKMFPNPASEELNLSLYLNKTTDIRITVFDMQGKEVRKINTGKLSMGTHNQSLNVSELNGGKYVILVESDFGYISRSFSIIRNFK